MYKATDSLLKTTGPLMRYTSLSAAGLSYSEFPVSSTLEHEVSKWKQEFKRLLISKFKNPMLTRGEMGQIVNVDEALEGVHECYRVYKPIKTSPVRIGLNVSRDYFSDGIVGMRGGAVLALVELLTQANRPYTVECAYGNGINARARRYGTCHIRIEMIRPTIDQISRIIGSEVSIRNIGNKVVHPIAKTIGGQWVGYYRFSEIEAAGIHEYDFVLDRIETDDKNVERNRLMDQLLKYKLR